MIFNYVDLVPTPCLQSQLEDLEQQARNAGKSKIAALQNKVRQSEADLDNEIKRRMDAEKVCLLNFLKIKSIRFLSQL